MHESTIAIVDDDPARRQLFDNALRRAGYRTILCRDGEEGLALAPKADLMLLDVRLPGLSGLDVLARLREQGFELPVILLTAYIDVRDAVAAIKGGALDYLEKCEGVPQARRGSPGSGPAPAHPARTRGPARRPSCGRAAPCAAP